MARGKVTYKKKKRGSLDEAQPQEISLCKDVITKIESALGRELTRRNETFIVQRTSNCPIALSEPGELEQLNRDVQRFRLIFLTSANQPAAADVRATLLALAALPTEAEAIAALKDCDRESARLVRDAQRETQLTADLGGAQKKEIRAAAREAHTCFEAAAGRCARPVALFASFVWGKWLALGGNPEAKASFSETKASPLLSFALAIMSSVAKNNFFPSDMAKALRAAQTKKGSSTHAPKPL